MIKAFENASGKQIPYKIVNLRPGDVAICYADPDKAKVDLGWIAKKQIDEMCEDAWRWLNKNPNGYSSNHNIDSPYPTGEGFFVGNK